MIEKRAKQELQLIAANQAMDAGKMLGTIALPRNLNILSSRLPKPNYEQAIKQSPSECKIISDNMERIPRSRQAEGSHKPVPLAEITPSNINLNERQNCNSKQGKRVVHEPIKGLEQNGIERKLIIRPNINARIALPPRAPYFIIYL